MGANAAPPRPVRWPHCAAAKWHCSRSFPLTGASRGHDHVPLQLAGICVPIGLVGCAMLASRSNARLDRRGGGVPPRDGVGPGAPCRCGATAHASWRGAPLPSPARHASRCGRLGRDLHNQAQAAWTWRSCWKARRGWRPDQSPCHESTATISGHKTRAGLPDCMRIRCLGAADRLYACGADAPCPHYPDAPDRHLDACHCHIAPFAPVTWGIIAPAGAAVVA